MMMRDGKLLMPYFSPHLAQFPEDAKEEADKNRVLWTTDRESIVGLGYNRNLIRAADVPKNFAELARPENKGKIAVSGDVTGVRFIGAMIKAKGEEFVKQLRGLDIKMHMISGGAMHELMAAGEMPMSISIFRNHVLSGKPKGAPTEWVPMDLNPDQRRRRGVARRHEQPLCGVAFYRFSAEPRRAEDFRRKVSLRDLDQELRLQTLVSGKGHDHRTVREG